VKTYKTINGADNRKPVFTNGPFAGGALMTGFNKVLCCCFLYTLCVFAQYFWRYLLKKKE